MIRICCSIEVRLMAIDTILMQTGILIINMALLADDRPVRAD
jgi:hypothetical protein